MVVNVLAVAWGVLAAVPLAHVARRQRVVARARALGEPPARPSRRPIPRSVRVVVTVLGAPARRRATRAHDTALRREAPVAIDLLGVAVGAGCTPYAAVEVAARWCPPRAGTVLARVTSACRLGDSFEHALRAAGASAAPLAPVTDALEAASRLGAPVAPTLARLAGEARADLRRAAEARARTVPVRLLFPLVFLVLPAFGLLTVAPVLIDGLSGR